MGTIMKYSLDRLEQRRFELKLDCPNCGSARILISAGNGHGHVDDVSCPKCGIRIILDGLSITVVNEAAHVPETDMEDTVQAKGLIL